MAKADINILNHTDLRYLLIDNLNLYSNNSFFVEGNNPYNFNINKKSQYIYVKNSHSSGNGRTNPDESRIQIGKSKNFMESLNSGKIVFFLGYDDENGVFTAWNPVLLKERINQKKTVSVYSRFSTYKKARKNGIAIYEDTNGQKVISFKPEYIGLYLENYLEMHLSSEDDLIKLINKSDSIEQTGATGEEIIINNEEFKLTKTKASRDPNFRKKVYSAYGHRCAITGIQLSLIEAAHIIPHSHEKGTDEINNGICLSASYHTAYDLGLIYFDDEYNILVNEEKLSYLSKIGIDGGFRQFHTPMFEKINLPSLELYFPSKEYIKIANNIRGINCT